MVLFHEIMSVCILFLVLLTQGFCEIYAIVPSLERVLCFFVQVDASFCIPMCVGVWWIHNVADTRPTAFGRREVVMVFIIIVCLQHVNTKQRKLLSCLACVFALQRTTGTHVI